MSPRRRRSVVVAPLWLVLLCLSAGSVACQRTTSSLYELPPPPPQDERRNVSLIPGEDDRRSERSFREARASLVRLDSLLKSKRFEEALELMSQETVAMLEFVSPEKNSSAPAAAVFTLGRVVIDGQVEQIDPIVALLAEDLSDLRDSVEGQSENESTRRKEIFAVSSSSPPRKIVMIKEGDSWLLHRTTLKR